MVVYAAVLLFWRVVGGFRRVSPCLGPICSMCSVSSCLMVVSSCFCGGLELLGVGFVLFNMLLFVLLFGGGGGFSTSPVVVRALGGGAGDIWFTRRVPSSHVFLFHTCYFLVFGSHACSVYLTGYSSLQQYFGGDVGFGFGGGVVVTDFVWFGGGGDESGRVDGLVKLPVCCMPVVVLTQWCW
jgi:hypothetical protein